KPQSVIDTLERIPFDQLAISSITVAELEYGVRKSSQTTRNQQALIEFLTPFYVLDFDRKATVEYGIIRAELEKQGTPIGPLDTLIAAHARSMNLTLVTNNEKEFTKVNGLNVVNWAK